MHGFKAHGPRALFGGTLRLARDHAPRVDHVQGRVTVLGDRPAPQARLGSAGPVAEGAHEVVADARLCLDGTWQRIEIDALGCNIIPDRSGTLNVTFLLTDQDAAKEPLPLLAHRFAGDAVRYRTPTFSLEAPVRLRGRGRHNGTTSHRYFVRMGDTGSPKF